MSSLSLAIINSFSWKREQKEIAEMIRAFTQNEYVFGSYKQLFASDIQPHQEQAGSLPKRPAPRAQYRLAF